MDDAHVEPLLIAIRNRLPAGVELAGGWLGESVAPAGFAEEAAAVARAVDKRKREFLFGRYHARCALEAIGGPWQAIPMGPDRAPQWPNGYIGSISHSSRCCAAIASVTASYRGLGLDLEADDPLDPGVAAMILHQLDTAKLGELDAKLCFVIKEAVYKAFYCVTRRFLSFEAVSLIIDPGQQQFEARLHDDISVAILGQAEFRGNYVRASGHYGAILAIPALG